MKKVMLVFGTRPEAIYPIHKNPVVRNAEAGGNR